MYPVQAKKGLYKTKKSLYENMVIGKIYDFLPISCFLIVFLPAPIVLQILSSILRYYYGFSAGFILKVQKGFCLLKVRHEKLGNLSSRSVGKNEQHAFI
jgi:hypothetical protein